MVGNSLFGLPVAKKRKLQPVELYSRDHYGERVKPLVEAELAAAHAENGGKVGRAKALDIVKRVTRKTFEEEPQDLKDVIAAKADAQGPPDAEIELSVVRTPEQLDR